MPKITGKGGQTSRIGGFGVTAQTNILNQKLCEPTLSEQGTTADGLAGKRHIRSTKGQLLLLSELIGILGLISAVHAQRADFL